MHTPLVVASAFILAFLGPVWSDARAAEAPPAAPAEASADRIGNSVVQVFSTRRDPDFVKPWTKQSPHEMTGSGVIIEGKRILTNAHVVTYASQIQVQANHAGDKVSATVVAVAPEIDLALLKLDDESFFGSRPAVARAGNLPMVKDTVMATVSRPGGAAFPSPRGLSHASNSCPTARRNPGCASRSSRHQPRQQRRPRHRRRQNGWLGVRPAGGRPEHRIHHPMRRDRVFLSDIADGKYDGKPTMFDDSRRWRIRRCGPFSRSTNRYQGIVVNMPYGKGSNNPLKKWDLITRIGDNKIDDQGMVNLGNNLRVRFQYLIQKLAKNGKVPLTVIRAGKELSLQVPVSTTRPMVVADLPDKYPSYFIYGPLVFSSASMQFVGAASGWNRGASGASSARQ